MNTSNIRITNLFKEGHNNIHEEDVKIIELASCYKKRRLMEWLQLVGGSSNIEDYVQMADSKLSKVENGKDPITHEDISVIRPQNNSRYLPGVKDESVVICQNSTNCFCSTKISNLHFIKRRGFLGNEYPLIMVGSTCFKRFNKENGGPPPSICINCITSYRRNKYSTCLFCRDRERFENYKLNTGKYKGTTYKEVYKFNKNYCNFIIENCSDINQWQDLIRYILIRRYGKMHKQKSQDECKDESQTNISINTPNLIGTDWLECCKLTTGKYIGQTYKEVYQHHYKYCLFIIDNCSNLNMWSNFIRYINFKQDTYIKEESSQIIIGHPPKVSDLHFLKTTLEGVNWPDIINDKGIIFQGNPKMFITTTFGTIIYNTIIFD